MHGITASSCHADVSFIIAVTKPGDLSPRAAAEELRPPAGCTPSPPGLNRARNGLDQQRRIPAAAPASSPQAAGPPEGHGDEAVPSRRSRSPTGQTLTLSPSMAGGSRVPPPPGGHETAAGGRPGSPSDRRRWAGRGGSGEPAPERAVLRPHGVKGREGEGGVKWRLVCPSVWA